MTDSRRPGLCSEGDPGLLVFTQKRRLRLRLRCRRSLVASVTGPESGTDSVARPSTRITGSTHCAPAQVRSPKMRSAVKLGANRRRSLAAGPAEDQTETVPFQVRIPIRAA